MPTTTQLHPRGDALNAAPLTDEQESRFAALLAAGEEHFGSMEDTPSQEEATSSLSAMLATPQPIDLWPGHCYTPPTALQLDYIFPAQGEISDLYNEGTIENRLLAITKAAEVIALITRRVNTETFPPTYEAVSSEYVKGQLEPDEIAALIPHILSRQGVEVKKRKVEPNYPTGLLSFQQSADTIPATDSNIAED